MPYDDPFRLRVMKVIAAAIKTVTPENEYNLDLSDYEDADTGKTRERVFRGRTIFGDDDPVPMVVILEDPRAPDGPPQPQHASAHISVMRLLVQGFVADDKDHPLDPAYHASAAIIKALVLEKKRLDLFGMKVRIQSMHIETPVHRPADNEVSSQAYFVFGLRLTLVEKADDPFF